MFTGIIESLGKIIDVKVDRGNIDFTIESDIGKELKVDQSVSHNGVCLTVTDTNNNHHTVTAVKETLDKSSLKNFSVNDLINLERAMKLGERLDGHLVQGHVDGIAKCIGVSVNDGSWIYKFEFDISNEVLLIEKGSICINGVSLTVFDIAENTFKVTIIPYTYEKQPGELMSDLVSFHDTRDQLYDFYEEKWDMYPDENYVDWLFNDISRFMNNDIPSMVGISDGNIEKMRRIYFFSDKSDQYIFQFVNYDMMIVFSSETSINILIGCLTPRERLQLLTFIHSIIGAF